MISILRQEPDSMIRAIFLLSIVDMEYRNALLLPRVLEKISGNLDCYLKDLEGGKVIEHGMTE
ncbi:MAG TPA: hypothetical protein VKV79_05550 [Terriglobia bacterium]|nr:hypothetical protein [Terriglobia bacterium]